VTDAIIVNVVTRKVEKFKVLVSFQSLCQNSDMTRRKATRVLIRKVDDAIIVNVVTRKGEKFKAFVSFQSLCQNLDRSRRKATRLIRKVEDFQSTLLQ
jgi:CTP-dependent riboflavin kinase